MSEEVAQAAADLATVAQLRTELALARHVIAACRKRMQRRRDAVQVVDTQRDTQTHVRSHERAA